MLIYSRDGVRNGLCLFAAMKRVQAPTLNYRIPAVVSGGDVLGRYGTGAYWRLVLRFGGWWPNSDCHGDFDPNSNSHQNAYTNGQSDSDGNGDSYGYSDSDGNGCANSDRNSVALYGPDDGESAGTLWREWQGIAGHISSAGITERHDLDYPRQVPMLGGHRW